MSDAPERDGLDDRDGDARGADAAVPSDSQEEIDTVLTRAKGTDAGASGSPSGAPDAPSDGASPPPGRPDLPAAPLGDRRGSGSASIRRRSGGSGSSGAPTLPGDLANKYDDITEIDRGGMGAVFRALDRDLERPVAIKVLHESFVRDRRLVDRFFEEARLTAPLEHPGVTPLHDIGIDEVGRVYFVMKLVRGENLSLVLRRLREEEWIARSRFPRTRLLNAFLRVCETVGFAHSRNVIHRDLKPQNIMLGDYGEVLVLDWGLAKRLDLPASGEVGSIAQLAAATGKDPTKRAEPKPAEPERDEPKIAEDSGEAGTESHASPTSGGIRSADSPGTLDTGPGLTTTGDVIGTPAYMAPEQARGVGRGVDVGKRTDVYALGAVLYEILTLRPPYRGRDAASVIAKVLEGAPQDPAEAAPERTIPAELVAIVNKAMAREKDDRYPSVDELGADVRRFLEGHTVTAKRDTLLEKGVKWVRRNQRLALVVGLALLVVIVMTAGTRLVDRQRTAITVERLLDEAEEALRLAGAANERAGEAEERASRVTEAIRGPEPADGPQKRELFAREKEAAEARREVAMQRSAAIARLHEALGLTPGEPRARRLLAEIYLEVWERADREGRETDRDAARRLVEAFDPDGDLSDRLDDRGTISVTLEGAACRIELARYVAGVGLVLEAKPFGEPTDEIAAGTTWRSEALASGSLLLVATPTDEAFHAARVPVLLRRGAVAEVTIRLRPRAAVTERDLPPMEYVAAGEFRMSPDPRAPYFVGPTGRPEVAGAQLRPVWVGDFYMSRHEVTQGEYKLFLDEINAGRRTETYLEHVPAAVLSDDDRDRWVQLPSTVFRHPRADDETTPDADRWPVFGVSYFDALAYCAWLTGKARSAGLAVRFTLPTWAEWEKAARGTDGRRFPWGHRHDASFAKGGWSRPGPSEPEAVGSYPRDRSPYGVFDLGGSVCEWVLDGPDDRVSSPPRPATDPTELRWVKGGSWSDALPRDYACDAGWSEAAQTTASYLGFRVVHHGPER